MKDAEIYKLLTDEVENLHDKVLQERDRQLTVSHKKNTQDVVQEVQKLSECFAGEYNGWTIELYKLQKGWAVCIFGKDPDGDDYWQFVEESHDDTLRFPTKKVALAAAKDNIDNGSW